jgi:DegV family protein with EDD domain
MIHIIADTTCGLPQEQMKALKIPYLPQIIIFGETSYRDDTEIDTATFLSKLRASPSLPKTAAPPPELYKPIYDACLAKGGTIFVITPSSEISGTMRSAEVAAQDYPGADIRVIDSRIVAGGLGQMVLQAKEWADSGMDADVLEERLRALVPQGRVYFVVDTLEYLYKGGRIGGAKALFGSILQIKPILCLKNGRIDPVETQRTKKRALSRVQEIVLKECPCTAEARLAISHCDAEDEAREFAGLFTETMGFKDIPIYLVPPAIVVHGGPKILAVTFFAG